MLVPAAAERGAGMTQGTAEPGSETGAGAAAASTAWGAVPLSWRAVGGAGVTGSWGSEKQGAGRVREPLKREPRDPAEERLQRKEPGKH